MPPRSTAGCYTCKRRKKKCDETQPHCQRCIKSGKECEGYAPLESPDGRGIMRRGKIAPGSSAPRLQSSNIPDSQGKQPSSISSTDASTSERGRGDLPTPPFDSGFSFSHWPSTEDSSSFSPPEAIWHADTISSTSLPLVKELPSGLPTPFASLDPDTRGGANPAYYPGPGDYLIDPDPEDMKPFPTLEWPDFHTQLMGPGLPHASISQVKEEEGLEDDGEPKQEMYVTPAPDPNTVDNTLPFILQCYARWINLVIFEPGKAFHPLRETIVNKFMRSPEERSNIILLANAIGGLGSSLKPSPRVASLVNFLRIEAYENINKFISDKPDSEREVDRQKALEALDLMMEVVLIQRYSNSMLTIVKLMEAAAPIFRRACPEPMDQYVNLPGAILSPAVNIRHFATTDIIMSITTGRPMIFRYDTAYPPGIIDLIKQGYGMQWLHGIADQYIVILARINVLFEEYGANISSQYVTEIESQIEEVDISTERLPNPVFTVWKFTVRECWKLTMYIYLYMVLCRTTTDDPRVLKSVKQFVRLMGAVTPGRNPDSFLYIPLIIVGASAYRKADRAVIQRRMLGLQECINPGSCGYDAMNMLIDLWTRTDAEERPAVWHDLRMSAFRVTGI